MINIKVVNKSSNALPCYAHDGDAGMDLRADIEHVNKDKLFNCTYTDDCITIMPQGRALIPTGIHLSIPGMFYGAVKSRSGLAINNGILVSGVIDSNYTGDIGVMMFNVGSEMFCVHQGDRIAQLIIQKYKRAKLELVNSLEETNRNENGFGSTGI